MNKYLVLLMFSICMLLACREENKKNETGKVKPTASETKQRQELRKQFDTIIFHALNLRGSSKVDSTISYLNESLSLAQQLNNDTLLALVYRSLAGYFDDQAEYDLEVEYYYKAYEIYLKNGNYVSAANMLNNLAWGYIQACDYYQGIEQAKLGIILAEKSHYEDKKILLKSLLGNNIAIAYLELHQPDSSLYYNTIAFKLIPNLKQKQINHYAWINAQFGNIFAYKKNYQEAEKYFKVVLELKDSEAVADAAVYTISKYCSLLNKLHKPKEAINIGRIGVRIAYNAGLKRFLIDVKNEMRIAFEMIHQTDSAYHYAMMVSQLRDETFNTQKSIQLQTRTFNRNLKAKEFNYAIEKAKTEEQLRSTQVLQYIFMGGFVIVLLFAGLVLFQRNKIRTSKQRSDELLLNILPAEVAEELKSKGKTPAKHFDQVSVMFTDFKDFTQIAEKLSAQELVSEIHTCFAAFDQILEKHGIEKIKTIGDAYMCAGGIPVPNKSHALDVVRAAIEINQFVLNHSEERKKQGLEGFEIRIGIHSGQVVAGIVGIKKFAYDIWGDTVNIASRMESSGEAGKINISETTYHLVKDVFECNYRGKIQAKGKGEIDMYFVKP